MTLYNLRLDGDNYRISKFDDDMNVQSSYLTSTDACECPAGTRHTCRHRQMLGDMVERGLINSKDFWDFEERIVVPGFADEALPEIDDLDEGAAAGSGMTTDPELPLEGTLIAPFPIETVDTTNMVDVTPSTDPIPTPAATTLRRRI